MKRLTRRSLPLLAGGALLLLGACQPVMPEPVQTSTEPAAAPRELVVLAGAGQDTTEINAFFPASLHIRAGDTVTWKINSDEPHTTSFLSGMAPPPDPIPVPGGGPTDLMLNPEIAFPTRGPDQPVETYRGEGYINSGYMSNGVVLPPAETYSVSFDTPGTYQYNCLLHPTMVGEIVVEPATATDVPSQDEIDTMAQSEIAPLMDQVEALRTSIETAASETAADGSTFWHVPAGLVGENPLVELFAFLPQDLTIKVGDSVEWTSVSFHQISFHPGQPVPDAFIPTPQESGPPRFIANPEVVFPVIPAEEFDGTQYFGSGLIGPGPMPGGQTFTLKFSAPGTYEYTCAVHKELGMKGTITVVQ